MGKESVAEEKWYDRAKKLMKKKKISMERMGKHLNLGQSSMSMKLSGKRDSSIDDVKMIADVLGVALSELVEGDNTFIINDTEKRYLEVFRSMSETEKDVFMKLLSSFRNDENQS